MAAVSLLSSLEDVIQRGSKARREEMLKRITTLFIDGAENFNDAHVKLFDDVLARLIVEIEEKTRAELSVRLARVGNAPRQVVRRLAQDDNISVAGPVLRHSERLDDFDILDIAKSKGQAHLLAIANRHGIGEAVTDVILRRGDRDVLRDIAGNHGARLSANGFSTLIKRAEQDGILADKVGQRPDVSPAMLRELLSRATDVVQKRLLAGAKPGTKAEIKRTVTEVSKEVGTKTPARDFTRAQHTVLKLHRGGRLDQASIQDAATGGRYEEMVAGLSLMSKVPLDVVERLMGSERPDPVLILGKSVGFGWRTVQAIIVTRAKANRMPMLGLEAAAANFEKLSPSTAQRVVRFWQLRQSAEMPA
jgi:uncharacterized protein (DUF2336 family)